MAQTEAALQTVVTDNAAVPPGSVPSPSTPHNTSESQRSAPDGLPVPMPGLLKVPQLPTPPQPEHGPASMQQKDGPASMQQKEEDAEVPRAEEAVVNGLPPVPTDSSQWEAPQEECQPLMRAKTAPLQGDGMPAGWTSNRLEDRRVVSADVETSGSGEAAKARMDQSVEKKEQGLARVLTSKSVGMSSDATDIGLPPCTLWIGNIPPSFDSPHKVKQLLQHEIGDITTVTLRWKKGDGPHRSWAFVTFGSAATMTDCMTKGMTVYDAQLQKDVELVSI
eukprot:SAG31_NODE_521_length_14624_cov_34.536867_10_plen_278_part_00